LLLSPAAEMFNSLHVLTDPSHHPSNAVWVAQAAATLPGTLHGELTSLGEHFGEWLGIADLVEALPPEESPVPEFIARLAEAAPELVVRVALGGDIEAAAPSNGMQRAAIDSPQTFRDRLVHVLRDYWSALFAAEWERRAPVLEQRRAHEAARLDHAPPEAWLASLHDRISFDSATGEIVFHKARAYRFALSAFRRITCIPSSFSAPHLMVGFTADSLTIYVNTPYMAAAPELTAQRVLAVGRALGDETRLRIYKLTLRRPHYTQELAATMRLAEPTVSRHLKVLREAGLVRSEKVGGIVLYSGLLEPVDRLPAVLREYIRD
jgi:DNA-binding transcriptional ArsR family regulator